MSFIIKIYRKVFRNYESELLKQLNGCSSVLDVGCGSDSPLRLLKKDVYSVGVDAYIPSISESKKNKIHSKYYKMDVTKIAERFKPEEFDCVLANDLVEHLTKEDGERLINSMEKVAKRRVIIFTPNGFLPQGSYYGNPFQVHNSGWTADEMKARGYRVIGINGWKPLRGELASVRFRPRLFWEVVADMSQFLVRSHPRHAFQILCVKDKNEAKK